MSLLHSLTVFTLLHPYAPSTCVFPPSFPLHSQPRRWLLPPPALWVSRWVRGCRVSLTYFLYQCQCFWTDVLIRRRLQDHRGLCSRLFGFEAVYLHRSNVLRCRWCRPREPLPGRRANPPSSCCSENQGHPGRMVREPLNRRVVRYGMIHADS